jgi:hypothetical protein
LDEYFPYFVRERLIRDLIVFIFQNETLRFRTYIEQVLGLQSSWNIKKLDADSLQDCYPTILPHATFVYKPRSLKELCHIVNLIEEMFTVAKERRECSGHLSFRVVVEMTKGMRPALLHCNHGRGKCIVEMLELRPVRPFQPGMPPEIGDVGKRAIARRWTGPRA